MWHGVTRLGALVVPVSTRLTESEVAYIVEDSGAGLLVHDGSPVAARRRGPGRRARRSTCTGPELTRRLAAGRAEPPTGDFLGTPVVAMTYTSGTTGRPKGIARAAPAPARETPPNPFATFWGFGPDDVHLMCGPMYHTAPSAYALMSLGEGGTVVIMPTLGRRPSACGSSRPSASPRRRWCRPTSSASSRPTGAPMTSPACARSSTPPRRARCRSSAGSSTCSRPTRCGSTTAPAKGWRRSSPPRSGWPSRAAWGGPSPACRCGSSTRTAATLAPGEVGSIYVSSFAGQRFRYHNAPDKTESAWDGDYFTVGDMGWLDEDGYLFLADRRTDLIISGGVNIYPAEVEAALIEDDDVVDAAVIGLPDERMGQKVHAVVELRPGAPRDAEALTARLATRAGGLQAAPDHRVRRRAAARAQRQGAQDQTARRADATGPGRWRGDDMTDAHDVPGEARLLIDGKLVEASAGATFDNIDPTTEEVLGDTADGTAADMRTPSPRRRRAFDDTDWSTDHEFRRRCLEQFHAACAAHIEELRAVTVAEVGSPIALTYANQVDLPIDDLGYWVDQPVRYEYEHWLPRARRVRPAPAPAGAARGGGRGGGHHALELPAQPEPGQAGPRPGGRQHRGAQARPRHAVVGHGARPASSPRRPTSPPGWSTWWRRRTTSWARCSPPTRAST